MNAQQLYDEIKDALRYFGLAFNQMDQLGIKFEDDGIYFIHGSRRLHVSI